MGHMSRVVHAEPDDKNNVNTDTCVDGKATEVEKACDIDQGQEDCQKDQ